jgi:hypothetical protein
MAARFVLDASIVVAAVSPDEAGHFDSVEFLRELQQHELPLIEPPSFHLELYAVLTRKPRELKKLGFLTSGNGLDFEVKAMGMNELRACLAFLTAHFPGRCPTRGADLAYVWVAYATDSPLVTLDKGLQGFRGGPVTILGPADALRGLRESRAVTVEEMDEGIARHMRKKHGHH